MWCSCRFRCNRWCTSLMEPQILQSNSSPTNTPYHIFLNVRPGTKINFNTIKLAKYVTTVLELHVRLGERPPSPPQIFRNRR